MVVFCLCHGGPQLPGLQELGHQDAQAVQIGELRCEDLEDGLHEKTVFRMTEGRREDGGAGPLRRAVMTAAQATSLYLYAPVHNSGCDRDSAFWGRWYQVGIKHRLMPAKQRLYH